MIIGLGFDGTTLDQNIKKTTKEERRLESIWPKEVKGGKFISCNKKMSQVWELSFPPCSHLLHHAFHLGHIWYLERPGSTEEIKCNLAFELDAYPSWSSTALHLFHHVLQSTHALKVKFCSTWITIFPLVSVPPICFSTPGSIIFDIC